MRQHTLLLLGLGYLGAFVIHTPTGRHLAEKAVRFAWERSGIQNEPIVKAILAATAKTPETS